VSSISHRLAARSKSEIALTRINANRDASLHIIRMQLFGDWAMKPSIAELQSLIAARQRRLLELHQELKETERLLQEALREFAEHHSAPSEGPQEPEPDV